MGTYSSFILCFISCFIVYYSEVWSISVNNGAYEDINIVIQDSVPENEILLQRIQRIFNDASQLLFFATKQHVFFGKINIILPKTWSYKPEYTVIAARSELDSYITVEESSKKRPPHTKPKEHKCGVQGHYIYLPTGFLSTEGKTEWGYQATVLVHEWAHYRWGLYGEYITNKNARFYMDAGEWKQSRCNKEIKGEVGYGKRCDNGKNRCDTSDTSKKIDQNCKFCPDETQTDSSGSIMAYNWVDGVTMFCDDPDNDSVPRKQKHNKMARNKQNVLGNHRSAWEVMRDHDDFKSASLPASTNTTPVFQIKQESFCNRVFVLDVSRSMAGSRIDTLYDNSKYMIETLISDNSYLGIVWFATAATTMKNLTQITSEAIRSDLIANLPTVASGATCIGCGIDAALEMQSGSQNGLEIILISDGQNNEGDLDASIQRTVDAQVTVHTIAVSQAADTKLASMATRTGGVHVSYLEGEKIFLADAFLKVLPCGMTSYASESITVFSEKVNISSSNEASVTFDIDKSIGNTTAVRVLQDSLADIDLDLEVSGPNGVVNTKKANGKSVVLVLPGTAVAGQYNAKVKSSSQADFEFYVTSLPKDPEVVRVSSRVFPAALDFNGELPVIIADVMKGRAPVIGANVTAVVESGSSSCYVTLLDNGAVPDDFPDNGIYSAVIPRECLKNGRLSTKIYVRGENGTTHVLYGLTGAGSLDSDEDSNNTEVLQNSFQRVTVANEIYIANVSDQDIVAPGRITDVDIVDIVTENTKYGESRNFTITWTATGDDVNVGQAVEYELRISDDLSILSNNFTSAKLLDVVNTNFTPKVAGETEAIRIEVDAEKSYVSTAFFAVRAKDDAGNDGPVSNIVSMVVADGYRIKVEADVTVVYSDTAESVEETPIEEEKTKSLIGLAVGLSLAGAFIVIAISVVTCCVKKQKSKTIVEDGEFNSRISITTVTSVDSKLLQFFGTTAVRETVAKKTFLASQLQTIPEKEQAWAQSFISRPTSAISSPRKPFDIISQGECSIEMLIDNNEITSEKFEEYIDNDTHSLSRESQFRSNECTRKSKSPNVSTTGSSDNEAGLQYISEMHRTECKTKNKSKHGYMSEMLEEKPLTLGSLELPVLNGDEVNNEIKKYYEGVC